MTTAPRVLASLSIATLACSGEPNPGSSGRVIPPPAVSDHHEPDPLTAESTVPRDVDCTSLLPPDSAKANYHLACDTVDSDGEPERVDREYESFAWELFKWLTPTEAEPAWRSWVSFNPVPSDRKCVDIEDGALEEFLGSIGTGPGLSPPPTNPIRDIEGNLLEFDVRVNPVTRDRLCKNRDEVASFCQTVTGNTWSRDDDNADGPTHLKFAWKTITQTDCEKGREFLLRGDPSAPTFGCVPDTHGAVAIHVAIKGMSGGHNWTWATFSHRDNLQGEAPMFKTCDCGTEHCNRCPAPGEPTPLCREQAIAPEIAALNEAIEPAVYRNYLLVGVQRDAKAWSQDPTPRPSIVASEIIEWDRQNTDCVSCHKRALVRSTLGSDTDAWNCCLGDTCGQENDYFVRYKPAGESDPKVLVADLFWGLEDWFENDTDNCSEERP